MYGPIDRRAFAKTRWLFAVGAVVFLALGAVDSLGSHGTAWPVLASGLLWGVVAAAGFRIHAAWGPDPRGAAPTWGEVLRGAPDPERPRQPVPVVHLPGTSAQRHLVHHRWAWVAFAVLLVVLGMVGLVDDDPGAVPALCVAACAAVESVLAFRVTALWRLRGPDVAWSEVLRPGRLR